MGHIMTMRMGTHKRRIANFAYKASCEKSSQLLGLGVDTSTGHCLVNEVDAGSQGEANNVTVGDILMYINDESMQDKSLAHVTSVLKECRTGFGPTNFSLIFWRGPNKPVYSSCVRQEVEASRTFDEGALHDSSPQSSEEEEEVTEARVKISSKNAKPATRKRSATKIDLSSTTF